MSAKDAADAILRDFRTSMADMAVYRFDTAENARTCLDAMNQPDWLLAEQDGEKLALCVISYSERRMVI